MSGRIRLDLVDFSAFLSEIERVHCDLMRPFLVRNWCVSSEGPPCGFLFPAEVDIS